MMGIEHFEGTKPEFLAEEFFIGKLDGWAAFESLIGGLQKRATSPHGHRGDDDGCPLVQH
jgi:hypothetical protein